MTGCVYFIATTDRPGDSQLVKIGWTSKWASERMRSLQVACPDTLEVLAEVIGRPGDERTLHARFAVLHHRGEWFCYRDSLLTYVSGLVAREEVGGLV